MGGLGAWFGVDAGGFFNGGGAMSGLLTGNSWLWMIDTRTRSTRFTVRSARYADGTSCQTLERRQLPRSTRYHVQGELENVRQLIV